MNTSYEPLFKDIRAKCQRERWFGPYFFSPKRREHVRDDDPNCAGFVFPPASDEQVQATETSHCRTLDRENRPLAGEGARVCCLQRSVRILSYGGRILGSAGELLG
jgi:hypothetical protein